MNYAALSADVAEFMAEQKIANSVVIGHSMGGKTAMQLALQFPERVEKLVVSDIAPRAYTSLHEKIFAALLALDLAQFQTRQQMEDALAADIPNLVLRRFLLKNLGRDATGAFFWKINLRGLAENYGQIRAAISPALPFVKPTLFIRGGQSKYVKPEDEASIYELFPQAQIQTIAEASHWVHADQPEEFLRKVLAFI
jgi:pimeloyl-ACP methyl ester carboxylesterase